MGSGKQEEIFLFLEIKKTANFLWETGGYIGRWVAKSVAPACHGSSLSSNSNIFQKYKIGDISIGLANTL